MFVGNRKDADACYIFNLIKQIKQEEWRKAGEERKNMDCDKLAKVAADYYRTKLARSNPKLDEAVSDTVSSISCILFVYPLSQRITDRIRSMAESDEKVQKIFSEKPYMKKEVEGYWAMNPLTMKQECGYYQSLEEELDPLVKEILESQFEFNSEGIVRRTITWLHSFIYPE